MTMDKNDIVSKKLRLWAILCIGVSFLFLNSLKVPSIAYVITCGLYPWAVLLVCAFWLYTKKDEQLEKTKEESKIFAQPQFIIVGFLAVIAALLMPKDLEPAGMVFEMLLAYLGLFVIFFARAAFIPGVLVGIYGFSAGFPAIISRYMEAQYSHATVWMVSGVLNATGFVFTSEAQMINFFDPSGLEISLLVDSVCSGSGSMSIFVAIFALMMLDVKLPRKEAAYMFIFGVLGTTLQNVIRIIVIFLAGYYYGRDGVLAAHAYAGYILFPAWFLVFVYIYFMYAKKLSKDA